MICQDCGGEWMLTTWLDLPPWAIVTTLIVFYGLSATLLHLLSFHWPTRRHLAGLQGMTTPFFATANTLFALMIAFLGTGVWETYRAATQAVLHEREGIVSVLELANAVPSEAPRLRERINHYVASVIDDEWHRRPIGHGSDHTDAALRALLRAAASPQTGVAANPAVQAALLDAVQRIVAARSARLVLMQAPSDSPRWVAVLLLALLTQVTVAVTHLDRARGQVVALGLSTAAAIIALGLVAILERPFDGANQVSPEPLQRAIADE
jgi:Protein of unknown function (DUF4239)